LAVEGARGVEAVAMQTPPRALVVSRAHADATDALVAFVRQRLVDDGCPRCFLFTNVANRTSNKIYRALGYEHVSDFRFYGFPASKDG
jgi:hypothetical protein